MKKTVNLYSQAGMLVGHAEIDAADGEPRVLSADTGVLFVRAWGEREYIEAIPVAVIVEPAKP